MKYKFILRKASKLSCEINKTRKIDHSFRYEPQKRGLRVLNMFFEWKRAVYKYATVSLGDLHDLFWYGHTTCALSTCAHENVRIQCVKQSLTRATNRSYDVVCPETVRKIVSLSSQVDCHVYTFLCTRKLFMLSKKF